MSASLCIAAVMSGAATVNCNLKIKVTVLFVFPVTYVGSEDDINNSALIKTVTNKGKIFPKAPLNTHHYYLYNRETEPKKMR